MGKGSKLDSLGAESLSGAGVGLIFKELRNELDVDGVVYPWQPSTNPRKLHFTTCWSSNLALEK
jgi:hypothetical protein